MINKKFILNLVVASGVTILGGCAQPETETPSSNPDATDATQQNEATNDFASLNVSLDTAITIFQEEYPDVDITQINLEKSLGSIYYEIEGVDEDQEYELRINADNEEIDRQNSENLDLDEKNGIKSLEDKLDLTELLSIPEILEIVMNEYPEGSISSLELSQELNTTHWEIEINDNQINSISLKIHAQTGEILAVDND